MQDLISIIALAYNNEPYFEKCLYSIINNTYSNLGIIVIDDESIANTYSIYKNICVIDNDLKAMSTCQ